MIINDTVPISSNGGKDIQKWLL